MTPRSLTDADATPHRRIEDDESPRIKISISVSPELLERRDTYRRMRGGLNRSALFSLAADWFMQEHPVKR
jgi:metal-responsive CopG/Arc/MetJ family transcriptional regulator